MLSVTACKAIEPLPTSQPVVVGGDTVATVTTISVGKKSTVTIQTGTGNVASTAKTNNTGRAADAGANGGQSEAITHNRVPLWAIGLVLLLGAAGGIWGWSKWQAWRARPG
jgi:hypothetical protein